MSAPWRRWQCRTCGEIYDEAAGDPEGDVPPGTRFEDLDPDWICPNCGSAKDDYVLLAD